VAPKVFALSSALLGFVVAIALSRTFSAATIAGRWL
jgi:hypothetical protein